jgi:hypothetical protein
MAWRFRKSISMGKLFRVNISRSGVGVSVGVPGYRVSVGADGKVRRTVSIPGTGMRNTEVIGSPGPKGKPVLCPSCNQKVSKSDSFCKHCGKKI